MTYMNPCCALLSTLLLWHTTGNGLSSGVLQISSQISASHQNVRWLHSSSQCSPAHCNAMSVSLISLLENYSCVVLPNALRHTFAGTLDLHCLDMTPSCGLIVKWRSSCYCHLMVRPHRQCEVRHLRWRGRVQYPVWQFRQHASPVGIGPLAGAACRHPCGCTHC